MPTLPLGQGGSPAAESRSDPATSYSATTTDRGELGEQVGARAEEKVVGENLVRDTLADEMPVSEAFRIDGVI